MSDWRAADETAAAAERFAERADADVAARMQDAGCGMRRPRHPHADPLAKREGCSCDAAAVRAEDAGGVGFVDA